MATTTKWHYTVGMLEGFKRYKCSVQYKGSKYSGWQSNSGAHLPSVEYCLVKVM